MPLSARHRPRCQRARFRQAHSCYEPWHMCSRWLLGLAAEAAMDLPGDESTAARVYCQGDTAEQ